MRKIRINAVVCFITVGIILCVFNGCGLFEYEDGDAGIPNQESENRQPASQEEEKNDGEDQTGEITPPESRPENKNEAEITPPSEPEGEEEEENQSPTPEPEPTVYNESGVFESDNGVSLKLRIKWSCLYTEGEELAQVRVEAYLVYTSLKMRYSKAATLSAGNTEESFTVAAFSDIRDENEREIELFLKAVEFDTECNGELSVPVSAQMHFGGKYEGVKIEELIASGNISLAFQ